MANVLDEKLKTQAYEQAKSGNWDAVGETINQLAGYYKDGVDSTGNVGWSGSGENWAAAKKYMNDLQSEFSYDANEYYGNMIRENGGTYNGSSGSSSGGGSRGSSGGSSGGGSLTDYLEYMYAANLEAELAALKSSYDTNVLDLERQADLIAEQYRAARNQAAANNQQQINAFNEFALASGLNTGTSGQAALSQSMAYQNTLGNLGAQQASSIADNSLQKSKLAADYSAQLQALSAQNAAQRSQALYEEMVRQEKAKADAEAAAAEALFAREKFDYQKEQDELDYKLALAKLRQSNKDEPVEYKPKLTVAQVNEAIEKGLITDSVRKDYEYYFGEQYNPIRGVNDLGQIAKNLVNYYTSSSSATGLTEARKKDLMNEYDNGRITNDELNYILDVLGVK